MSQPPETDQLNTLWSLITHMTISLLSQGVSCTAMEWRVAAANLSIARKLS
jgi:hypothetical protein